MPLHPVPDDECWEAFDDATADAYEDYKNACADAAMALLVARSQCASGAPGDQCRTDAMTAFNAAIAAASAALNAALEAAIAAFLACEGVTESP